MVFVELDEIYKEVNDHVFIGDKIGRDNSMSIYTQFMLLQYNNVNIFPQFNNNKLYFTGKTGVPIYSMNKGIVKELGYDNKKGKGSYIIIIDHEREMNIEY